MFAFSAGDPSSPRSRELPAGLADRVRPATPVAGRTLPVPPPLAPLFPGGSLRRGTTTTVAGPPGHGATTLALALLAAASAAGSWCAAVGLPDPGRGGGRRARARSAPGRLRAPPRATGGPRRPVTSSPGSTPSWCARPAGPA